MKYDENIESMFSRFQVLVSELQVLSKSFTIMDHVKKVLRSLPKVTTIQEAKDLNSLSLEGFVSNLQSHEMELNGDESGNQVKTMTLNSAKRYEKSSQTKKLKEATHDETYDEESDYDELAFIIKRFKHLSKKKNKFSSKRNDFKGLSSRSKD